jgi:hypothetical protein
MRPSTCRFALLLVIAACGAAPARAQFVHGVVLYDHNDWPVTMATVRLVDDDGQVLATTMSDTGGRFALLLPEASDAWVHVEHPTAFDMVDGPLRRPEAGNALVTFHVVPRPFALEEISVEVEGRSRVLARTGFYERRRANAAYFIDEETIRRRRPFRTSDLIRNIPGVRFVEGTGAGFSGYPMMRQGERSLGGADRPCFPRVYLDGMIIEHGGTAWTPMQGFDQIVAVNDVVGLEVYRSPAETPVQFGGMTNCGVILLWTHGAR